jgi:hypothetical protein
MPAPVSNLPGPRLMSFAKRPAIVQQGEIFHGGAPAGTPTRLHGRRRPGATQSCQPPGRCRARPGTALRRCRTRPGIARPASPRPAHHPPPEFETRPGRTRYSYGLLFTNHGITQAYRDLINGEAPTAPGRFTSPHRARPGETLDHTPSPLPHRPRRINNARSGRSLTDGRRQWRLVQQPPGCLRSRPGTLRREENVGEEKVSWYADQLVAVNGSLV